MDLSNLINQYLENEKMKSIVASLTDPNRRARAEADPTSNANLFYNPIQGMLSRLTSPEWQQSAGQNLLSQVSLPQDPSQYLSWASNFSSPMAGIMSMPEIKALMAANKSGGRGIFEGLSQEDIDFAMRGAQEPYKNIGSKGQSFSAFMRGVKPIEPGNVHGFKTNPQRRLIIQGTSEDGKVVEYLDETTGKVEKAVRGDLTDEPTAIGYRTLNLGAKWGEK